MTRDQALNRIRKCLNLTGSSNPHEATAALRQAQKLMQQHGISDQDLQLADITQEPVRFKQVAPNAWNTTLAVLIADAMGCESITTSAHSWTGLIHTMVFYGPKDSVAMAGYIYDVLLRQLVRSRAAHVAKQTRVRKTSTKTARGDAYAMGWIAGASTLVQRMATGERQQALLLAYRRQAWPDAKPSEFKSDDRRGRWQDEDAGFDDGQKAQLNRGVGRDDRTLIGHG